MTAVSNKVVLAAREPRSITQIIADVQATNEPILLTIDGEPQMVCLSVESYRVLEDKANYWETVASLHKAEEQCDKGESKPAREFFEEFRQKHGIPR